MIKKYKFLFLLFIFIFISCGETPEDEYTLGTQIGNPRKPMTTIQGQILLCENDLSLKNSIKYNYKPAISLNSALDSAIVTIKNSYGDILSVIISDTNGFYNTEIKYDTNIFITAEKGNIQLKSYIINSGETVFINAKTNITSTAMTNLIEQYLSEKYSDTIILGDTDLSEILIKENINSINNKIENNLITDSSSNNSTYISYKTITTIIKNYGNENDTGNILKEFDFYDSTIPIILSDTNNFISNYNNIKLNISDTINIYLQTTSISNTYIIKRDSNIFIDNYYLQESILPDFSIITSDFYMPDNTFTIIGQLPGTYYYRIKTKNIDSKIEYSDIINVSIY